MKLKTVASIITLSLITTTMTQASIQNTSAEIGSTSCCNETEASIYKSMTTAQIQVEVEKHSNNKNLSFILGKELIKRWTQS